MPGKRLSGKMRKGNVSLRRCLVIAYHMLKAKENDRELGADHFDRIDVGRIRRSRVAVKRERNSSPQWLA